MTMVRRMFMGRRQTGNYFELGLAMALLLGAATASQFPFDCNDVYKAGLGQDGVYTVYPAGPTSALQVYCDMGRDDTDSPAKWTVIQRRMDGTVNFYRKWDDYRSGFGFAGGEHWLGLETMHLMTAGKAYELRVDMEDFEGQRVFAHYASFAVGPESDGYRLRVGTFVKGTAGDSLKIHDNQKFTTFDRDQDTHGNNCAVICFGGFWFEGCFAANPNGVYTWGPSPRYAGIHWRTFKGLEYSLKTLVMKIRPTEA